MYQVLNGLGQETANGTVLADGEERYGALKRYPVTLRSADLHWYGTFFGRAIGFYRKPPFPVLQVCWPDREGAFHWQEDSEDRHRQSQPCLWIPPGERPQGVWRAEL